MYLSLWKIFYRWINDLDHAPSFRLRLQAWDYSPSVRITARVWWAPSLSIPCNDSRIKAQVRERIREPWTAFLQWSILMHTYLVMEGNLGIPGASSLASLKFMWNLLIALITIIQRCSARPLDISHMNFHRSCDVPRIPNQITYWGLTYYVFRVNGQKSRLNP